MTKHNDWEGFQTLSAIDKAGTFNKWMFETILPNCQGKVLEIGSGIGNISRFFIEKGWDITLSDFQEDYCEILERKFGRHVLRIDLVHPLFDTEYSELLGTFDTVFALNVVEHIEDDIQAIRNCRKLLRENGRLVILVPAYQMLYNGFDVGLRHFRRYTKQTLSQQLKSAGMPASNIFYFNFIGIFGWWFSGRILKKKTIPEGQMVWYDRFVWLFRLVDQMIFRKAGLSVVAFSTKKS